MSHLLSYLLHHSRRILSTTVGLPGRWNDKTVILFDGFLCDLHEGNTFQDLRFELVDADGLPTSFEGAWTVVDNGYLEWSCTVPPFKDPTDDAQFRWSEWVESMRKDVECVFGIMKGRWRILKVGMRFRGNSDGLKTVDNTWKACCAFHNWLLDGDGYDPAWRGVLGNHEQEDCRRNEIPEAILARMPNGGAEYKSRSEYDSSGMYKGPWRVSDHTDTDGGSRRLPSFTLFRKKLVAHFSHKFLRNLVSWPPLECSKTDFEV